MSIRTWFYVGLRWISFLFCASSIHAQDFVGQTLQINTHFRSIYGKPTWLLIIRDETSGQVNPYVFDIKNNDNFWVALSYDHSYRITVSNLKFGAYATIKNFCRLSDGILSGKSMFITLSGDLTPNRDNSTCHVRVYHDAPFPIVTSPSSS